MAWLYVFIGGIIEIGWVLGLKYSNGFTLLVPSILTVISLIISFFFFTKSMKLLPIGTAYAVFTGIGTAGTVIIGMLLLGESASFLRILFILLLIGGIIGLKLISSDEDKQHSKIKSKVNE
ncbi:Quaternary ammonium compound-resistance protein SugE [compost metagenome]|uniref:DMT family transporter n=1 Tax=Aneurinibacillus migulanus TaxID=47500 RepID=UPI000F9685F8|nr:multidrug efflux SMR transporter [Aneurinibacillus migulanus]